MESTRDDQIIDHRVWLLATVGDRSLIACLLPGIRWCHLFFLYILWLLLSSVAAARGFSGGFEKSGYTALEAWPEFVVVGSLAPEEARVDGFGEDRGLPQGQCLVPRKVTEVEIRVHGVPFQNLAAGEIAGLPSHAGQVHGCGFVVGAGPCRDE